MQTPYNQLRLRQKERRQKLNLSVEKPNLSLETPRPFSFNPSLKKIRQSSSKSSKDKYKHQKRYFMSPVKRKKVNGMHQMQQSANQKNDRLIVQGSKCAQDLINRNRQKLQHLISKIKAHNAKHIDSNIPQLCLQKSKYRCPKQDKYQTGQGVNQKDQRIQGNQQIKKALNRNVQLHKSIEDSAQNKPVYFNLQVNKVSINTKSNRPKQIFSPKKSLVRTSTTCKTEEIGKYNLYSPMSFREAPSPKKKGSLQSGFNMKNLKGWQSFELVEDCPFDHPLDWS